MELTKHLTHDPRTLLGLSGVTQAETVHAEEDAPLHGLEAVAHVREGTGDDDGHRIVDVCRTHLLVDLDRFYDSVELFVDVFLNIHKVYENILLELLAYKHANLTN